MVGVPVSEPEATRPSETAATSGTAASVPSTFVPRSVQATQPLQPAFSGEGVSVLWFVLGELKLF